VNWSVYVIRAARGALYTGISTDVARRLEQHGAGSGSRYLRGRGPLALVYRCRLGDRSLATSVEGRLKRLSKAQKEELVRAAPARRLLLRRLGVSASTARVARPTRNARTATR
jgi:putative endonuclease